MAIRTDPETVKGILQDEYGPREDGSDPDVKPYIKPANVMTNAVAACQSTRLGQGLLPSWMIMDADALTVLEGWLTAHFYQAADPGYNSRSTAGGSGAFNGQTTTGLGSTRFGVAALKMDTSGCLSLLDKRAVAGGVWLGKTQSEQTTFEERN